MKFIFIFFLFFPMLFQAIGATITWNTFQTIKQGVQTTGTVVDVKENRDSDGDTYSPVLEYMCGSEQVEKGYSNMYSSSYPRIGDEIEIYCVPGESSFIQDSFTGKYFGVIFVVFPMLFQIIGGGGLYFAWSKGRKRKRLLASGVQIQAKIVDVGYNTSLQVNGRNPLRITCQYDDKDTNMVHEFYSDNIWLHDISSYVKKGDMRDVYISVKTQERDYSVYYMDIGDIPISSS